MSPTYAAQTSVSADSSRLEIERIAARWGADEFASGWSGSRAMIGFVIRGRQVRFTVDMPARDSKQFTLTPTGRTRSRTAAAEVYEQATRQRWRALALVIKAKLEAVEAGIVTFEQEFGMHMVLPGGQTVADALMPGIERALSSGDIAPLLAIGPSTL